ncbi:S41 family peptidase [Ningiella sp. W23]|uniref:S41 family peptidase n=1 Tax=Ningiella sp. W23 TaxID=3023715 RepID=UPI003757155D
MASTTEEVLFPIDEIKADLRQLFTELESSHYDLYANISKEDYQIAFAETASKITKPMNKKEIEILFQRFVALGNVGHSRIDLPIQNFMHYRASGGTMIPLFVEFNDLGVFISEVYSQTPGLKPGMQVTAIDNTSIEEWINEYSSYISADNQALANTLIEGQLPFLHWLIVGEKEEFSITIKQGDKAEVFPLKALSRDQQDILIALQETEESEKDLPKPREAKMLANQIAYLKPGPFYNVDIDNGNSWDTSAFYTFIDEAFDTFRRKDAKALIIDVRGNPGGTNSFSDYLISWFADRPYRFASKFLIKVSEHAEKANLERLASMEEKDETSLKLAQFYRKHANGERFEFSLPDSVPHKDKQFSKPVFVLIDNKSYSNAVSVAAIVKDYGFGTVIGQATADYATTYGSMEHFFLDNTQIKVGFPKSLIVRPNGDTTPKGVSPDIALQPAINEGGKDLMLEQAKLLVINEISTVY